MTDDETIIKEVKSTTKDFEFGLRVLNENEMLSEAIKLARADEREKRLNEQLHDINRIIDLLRKNDKYTIGVAIDIRSAILKALEAQGE